MDYCLFGNIKVIIRTPIIYNVRGLVFMEEKNFFVLNCLTIAFERSFLTQEVYFKGIFIIHFFFFIDFVCYLFNEVNRQLKKHILKVSKDLENLSYIH